MAGIELEETGVADGANSPVVPAQDQETSGRRIVTIALLLAMADPAAAQEAGPTAPWRPSPRAA